jgi:uncharacterized protein YwqG
VNLPQTKIKKKSGQWYSENGKFYWKQFNDLYGYSFTLYSPEQIEGVSRSASFTLAFAKDVNDESKVSGKKKLWFKQTVNVRIKDDVSNNVWIIYDDKSRKHFIRDLSEFGVTMQLPMQSIDIMNFEASEPERIDASELKQISKESSYLYNMVNIDSNGSIADYVTTC